MDLNEYHKLCLRTEADDHAMQASRLLDINGIVVDRLVDFGETAAELDILKKHIFYGKALERDDQEVVDEMPGVLDSAQRSRFAERIRLLHATIGIITEAEELLQALMLYVLDGTPLDRVNVLEECCDLDWYKNLALDSVGYTAADVPTTLIPKLEVRYAKKFNAQRALQRNLDAERASLEANARDDSQATEGSVEESEVRDGYGSQQN
jgi:hypothetical protein